MYIRILPERGNALILMTKRVLDSISSVSCTSSNISYLLLGILAGIELNHSFHSVYFGIGSEGII